MKKTQYYLRERYYSRKPKNIVNVSKIEKWTRLLGKDIFFKLLDLNPDIGKYLNEGDWELNPPTNNLLFVENVPVSSQNAISYISNFIAEHQNPYAGLYFEYLLTGYTLLVNGISEETFSFFLDIRKDFLEDLLSSIHSMTVRCIIHENNKGNDNYDSSQNPSFQIREIFWNNYPVLERCVIECSYCKAVFYKDMLQRLFKDKDKLIGSIFSGQEFFHISKIHYNIGDRHRTGAQTLCIDFDNNNSIIYKPHSLLADQIFYNLIEILGRKSKIDFYFPKIIERENYGWEEYVYQTSCKSEGEIKRYYLRIGVILFASWILGCSDLHYENLIAYGEFPIFIDFECLISPKVTNNKSSLAHSIRKDSVLSTGILPIYHWANDGKGIDLSALMGGQQDNSIFKSPVIKNYGKKDMHIVYDYISFPPGKNKAMLKDQFLLPNLFEAEVIAGFKLAYKSFISDKTEFSTIFEKLSHVKYRYLVADTQKYHLLLQSSFHPSVLKDAPERELLLNYLWNGRDFKSVTDQKVVSAEINDLLHADIPFFYFLPNETSLYDSLGNRIDDFFFSKPMEQLYQRITSLNKEMMEVQIRLIHLSLNSFGKEKIPNNFLEIRKMIEFSDKYTKRQLLSYAKKIADKLLCEAIEYESDISWIRAIVYDKKPGALKISTSGMYLYDGISGINLFLHLLCKISQENRYIQMRNQLDHILFGYTDSLSKTPNEKESSNSGLLNGEASLIFAYELYYKITGSPRYILYAKKHVSILMETALNDINYDLTDGISGAIISLLLLYKITNDDVYLDMAKELSDKLLLGATNTKYGIGWSSKSYRVPMTGAAHGNAGIILAFVLLFDATGNYKYYLAIKEALKYERNCFDTDTGNWKDYRGNVDLATGLAPYASWCHGSGGILFFRLLIKNYQWEPMEYKFIQDDIQRGSAFLFTHMNRPDLCLCHGECGNRLIEKFYRTMQRNQNSKITKVHHSNEQYIFTKEWYNPGLMNGYSGIGLYFLLLLVWDDLVEYFRL